MREHFIVSFIIIVGIFVVYTSLFAFIEIAKKKNTIEITLQDDERCSNINEVLNPALLKGDK